jgi:hypothetical protein
MPRREARTDYSKLESMQQLGHPRRPIPILQIPPAGKVQVASLGDLLKRQRPAGPSPPPQVCCDRYRLSDGFLVDGVTGLTWRFDEAQKAFGHLEQYPRSTISA